MDHDRERTTGDAEPLTPDGGISRRAMVAGTVVTAAVAFLPLSNFAFAQTSDNQDMVAFLLLSAALTGVDIQTLAPEFALSSDEILKTDLDVILKEDPGVDPLNIKNAYFNWINTHATRSSFATLLQFAKEKPLSQNDIIGKVNASDDTKFLARSIVLLWYLGSWYDPADLKNAATSPESVDGPIKQKVLSPTTYTQGLVWLIAGAHPMGYSNLQFGYWSRPPRDPNSPVDLFSPAKF
jgi:hypothetical protein